jgi:hypothetical protein
MRIAAESRTGRWHQPKQGMNPEFMSDHSLTHRMGIDSASRAGSGLVEQLSIILAVYTVENKMGLYSRVFCALDVGPPKLEPHGGLDRIRHIQVTYLLGPCGTASM